MVVVLAQMSFDDFIKLNKEEQKEYLSTTDFFDFELYPKNENAVTYTKKNIPIRYKYTLEWYMMFCKTPLYFWVIQTPYFYKLSKCELNCLDRHIWYKRWRKVPTTSEKAKDYPLTDNWEVRKKNIEELFEKINANNFKDNLVICVEI